MNVQRITSDNNPKLKSALRLHSSRGRKQQNRIVIFGLAEISRAIRSRVPIQEVFFDESRPLPDFLKSAESGNFYQMPSSLFEKLVFGDRNDGLVAIAPRPESSFADFTFSENAVIVVLQGLEKPGNVGAVFRSADGAGAEAVFLVDPVTDAFHPNAIRASLGTVFSMPTLAVTSSALLEFLKQQKFQILSACLDVKQDFFDLDLNPRTALVLGNEKRGLTLDWRQGDAMPFQLPMRGAGDSLNVSATAAILVYEAMRQRHPARSE